ncbi:MAG: ABC transporter ATP-binding protein [Gemmatimonadaceae bacterium]
MEIRPRSNRIVTSGPPDALLALELENIAKRFGTVEALGGASIKLERGKIHALLGENGAGKTTLMRIAFGMLRPDAGVIRVNGVAVRFASVTDAIANGIGMVHQHFTFVPAMTVAENVALGSGGGGEGKRGLFRPREARERILEIGSQTGLVLDPDARAGSLPASAAQRLELVKALAHGVRILILDEPTTSLAPAEVESLFDVLKRLTSSGNTVVIITHKLREALTVATDITVLRRGQTVAVLDAEEASEEVLAMAMLGESPVSGHGDSGETRLRMAEGRQGEVAISVRALNVAGAHGELAVRDVTLDVRRGEILAVAGVEGAGQQELLHALAGRVQPAAGKIQMHARSVAFVPEDRQREALVMEFALYENVALRGIGAVRGFHRMRWPDVVARTTDLIERFDVRAPGVAGGPHSITSTLSGGNQQKLVLARELEDDPEVVIAENPTRGLDIAATAAVLARLRAARDSGAAVVVYSSDLDEVLSLADRVIVMFAGRAREVSADRETVGLAMLGVGSNKGT